jgi:hypothetical protein
MPSFEAGNLLKTGYLSQHCGCGTAKFCGVTEEYIFVVTTLLLARFYLSARSDRS